MVLFLCGEGPKKFFISRELWRLEISAVEEQRPFWELPWRPRADWGGTKKFFISRELWRLEIRAGNHLFATTFLLVKHHRSLSPSRGNMTLGS